MSKTVTSNQTKYEQWNTRSQTSVALKATNTRNKINVIFQRVSLTAEHDLQIYGIYFSRNTSNYSEHYCWFNGGYKLFEVTDWLGCLTNDRYSPFTVPLSLLPFYRSRSVLACFIYFFFHSINLPTGCSSFL